MRKEHEIAMKLMIGVVLVGSALNLVDNAKEIQAITKSPEFTNFINPFLKKDMA